MQSLSARWRAAESTNQADNKACQGNLEAKSKMRLNMKTYPEKTKVYKSFLRLDDLLKKEREPKTG